MTAQRPAPPVPAPPYTPAWMFYVYDERAYLTFDGRIQATATCSTPAQVARIEALYGRLTHCTHRTHRSRRSACRTP